MTSRFALKNYDLPDKYGSWLGYRPMKWDRKKHEAVLELDLREDHLSPAGRIHGGGVPRVFRFACAAAAMATGL